MNIFIRINKDMTIEEIINLFVKENPNMIFLGDFKDKQIESFDSSKKLAMSIYLLNENEIKKDF